MERRLQDVVAIDLHRGTRAKTGVVIGGAVGAVLTVAALTRVDESELSTGGVLLIGGSFTASLAVIGALFGGLFDVWESL